MQIAERVQKLRELMKEKGMDAYVVPSADAHQSEYVAPYWKSRQWISGFTGSAGTVVVTAEDAGLWTDGRYYIQAEKQIEGSGISLFKMGESATPTVVNWLKQNLKEGACVGFDGRTVSTALYKDMAKSFRGKKIKMDISNDLIGQLWTDRPEIPTMPVFVHELKYAGLSRLEKLAEVRKEMDILEGDHYLLSALEDIAWLFNIRGNDVSNTPVVYSYALISSTEASLLIDTRKLSVETAEEFKREGIAIYEYEKIGDVLKQLTSENHVIYDPDKTNALLFDILNDIDLEKIEAPNITTKLKAVKSEVEIANLRNSHIKDGVALVRFMRWIDLNLGKEKITEVSADKKLEGFRRAQLNNLGPSFDTIAGYKEHAAMMHYKATPESDYELKPEGLFLVDSGGQYLDGTTDTTRTIVLGPISELEKRDYTLVLKAHIGLATARFLYGCTGSNLDIMARKPIWAHGLDYRCGTGHGVGYLLSVHEGPMGFSKAPNNVKLEKGMILTNEPGIYTEGSHGVRIENTMLVAEDFENEYGKFMKFEIISFCPIDLDGIDVAMLDENERSWLNNYHTEVYSKLSPHLDEAEKAWLKKETKMV